MHNWAKGVYEKWDINKGFPNRNEILRAGARAGATVIRYGHTFIYILHTNIYYIYIYIYIYNYLKKNFPYYSLSIFNCC